MKKVLFATVIATLVAFAACQQKPAETTETDSTAVADTTAVVDTAAVDTAAADSAAK